MDSFEKKYKDALARMELCIRTGLKITPEYIFPELKESEDEKIRIALISAINNICNGDEGLVTFNGFSKEQVLTWLEKQGEQKPAWSEEDEKIGKVIDLLGTIEVKKVDLDESARNYLLHEHVSPLNEVLHQADLKVEMQYHKDIEDAYKAGFELGLKAKGE